MQSQEKLDSTNELNAVRSGSLNGKFEYLRCHRYTVSENGKGRIILQFIDESAKMIIQQARVEKLTMSQVNATVSHEIRNPINAIHS